MFLTINLQTEFFEIELFICINMDLTFNQPKKFDTP